MASFKLATLLSHSSSINIIVALFAQSDAEPFLRVRVQRGYFSTSRMVTCCFLFRKKSARTGSPPAPVNHFRVHSTNCSLPKEAERMAEARVGACCLLMLDLKEVEMMVEARLGATSCVSLLDLKVITGGEIISVVVLVEILRE